MKSLFRWKKSKHGTAIILEKPCRASLDILDDSNWAEQPVKSQPLHHDNTPPTRPTYSSMSNSEPVPEFAHLRISNRTLEKSTREHTDSIRPMSFPAAPTYRPRRYAKTPVSRIGQLEGTALRRSATTTARKLPSVELLAESYRALLEPCYDSVYRDTHSELPRMEEQSEKSNSLHSFDRFPITPSKPRAGSFESTGIKGSPGSDDGTLVGFEEDAFYPRCMPHTSELPRAIKEHEQSAPRPATPTTPAPGNPRLEISLDLLTQELSSAMLSTHLQLQPSAGRSALQIWVMIEAYEKLRDQLLDMRADADQTILAMFDMWLSALHRIHDQVR